MNVGPTAHDAPRLPDLHLLATRAVQASLTAAPLALLPAEILALRNPAGLAVFELHVKRICGELEIEVSRELPLPGVELVIL